MKRVLHLRLWVKITISVVLLTMLLFLYSVNVFDNVVYQQLYWFALIPTIGSVMLYFWE